MKLETSNFSAEQAVTADTQAILLLCSSLALPRDDGDVKPLALNEWNDLALRIAQSGLKHPGALLGETADSLPALLGISDALALRLQRLLSRGGQLAVELEELGSLGIWVTTRADDTYPARLKQTLRNQAPSVIFGAGDTALLTRDGLAIVGSRNVDEAGTEFALEAGRRSALDGLTVVSGAARGVDRQSMTGALEADGNVVGVLADSLVQAIKNRDTRRLVTEGRVTLITQSHPKAHFTTGAAMQRNKVIYGLSCYALVVASDKGQGGTWAGAIANLKAGWVPLFVRSGDSVPEGNKALLALGGVELPEAVLTGGENLRLWLEEHARKTKPGPSASPTRQAKGKSRLARTQADLLDSPG